MTRSLALPAAAAACIATAASPTLRADGVVLVGPVHCRFELPTGWSPDTRWSGACRDGLAQGRGVLREFDRQRVRRFYFGAVDGGRLQLGAIDLGGGWRAGRFERGQVIADGDRNTLIRAFDEASAAARELADAHRAAGRTASARFYEDKSRRLAEQLD